MQGLTLAEPRQLRLRAPSAEAQLLSVGLTSSGLAAFWSDGSLQQYERSAAAAPSTPSATAPSKAARPAQKENAAVLESVPTAVPRFVRRLRGFSLPSHQVNAPSALPLRRPLSFDADSCKHPHMSLKKDRSLQKPLKIEMTEFVNSASDWCVKNQVLEASMNRVCHARRSQPRIL